MTRFASATLLLPVLGTLLLAVPASAESIQLSQQGRLADVDGVPLEGSHELAIGLYDDDAAGNELWSSSFSVDLVGGYYSVILGEEGTLDDYLFAESGVWMQLTVRNDDAAERAETAGLSVVMNRCPKIEYARLSGELSWGGFNSGVITSKRRKF